MLKTDDENKVTVLDNQIKIPNNIVHNENSVYIR